MPAPVPTEVTASQQRELKRIVKAKTSSQRDVFRASHYFGLGSGAPQIAKGAVCESFGYRTLEEAVAQDPYCMTRGTPDYLLDLPNGLSFTSWDGMRRSYCHKRRGFLSPSEKGSSPAECEQF
jgi:hypothetical protein